MEKDKLEQHRITALDLYESITTRFQIEPSQDMTRQHRNISNNEFKVAVVGKVKAGKSTFINAILGEPLMPSDVREATCAIVEIFKSDTKYVYAKFLDGREYKAEDDFATTNIDEAHEFLKNVAAVQEKYRDLPVAQLNNLLVSHFDETKMEAVFLDGFIDEWIEIENPENIHRLPEAEFNRKIKEYLEEHKTGCQIPLTIEVGFPHEFKIDQFHIIDTPGIGTISGLGEKTKKYITEHADAVIYLHKESPTDESLQNALNMLAEEDKKNIFLVLTHRSAYTPDNSDALFEDTKKMFPQIPANRVFSVDSLTELAIAQFYGKEFEAIKNICKTNPSFGHVCKSALFDSDGNVSELLDILEQQSNMNGLIKELQYFSEKALSIQLHDFITELRSHLEAEERKLAFNLSALESEYRDPQYFSSLIDEIKQEMIKLKNELNDKTSKIVKEFSLSSARGEKTLAFEKIYSDIEEEINGNGIESLRIVTKSSVNRYFEKIYNDFYDKIHVFIEELQSEVMKQINSQTSTLDGEYSITIPKVVLSEIWQDATDKATETKQKEIKRKGFKRVYDFIPFVSKLTMDVRCFNIDKFIDEAKISINNDIVKTKTCIAENTDSMVLLATKRYKKIIGRQLEDRELFLDAIKNDQSSNEYKIIKIDALSERVGEIQKEIKECQKCEVELAC